MSNHGNKYILTFYKYILIPKDNLIKVSKAVPNQEAAKQFTQNYF